MIFINRKEILSFLSLQADLDIVVDPEVDAQHIIQIPAKTVIFHRGHNAQQPRIVKKIVDNFLGVQFQFKKWPTSSSASGKVS